MSRIKIEARARMGYLAAGKAETRLRERGGVKLKKARMVVLALAAGALVAGCGGDDDDSSADDSPKQQYIAQGDEICALGTLRIGSEAQSRFGTTAPPPEQAPQFAQEVVAPTLRNEVLVKLRALTPPPGDEKTVAAIYAALQKAIAAIEADPALYTQPGVGGAFDEANRLAQTYGFAQCGQG